MAFTFCQVSAGSIITIEAYPENALINGQSNFVLSEVFQSVTITGMENGAGGYDWYITSEFEGVQNISYITLGSSAYQIVYPNLTIGASGTGTMLLPRILAGTIVNIVQVGPGTVTIEPYFGAGDLINGASSLVLNQQYSCVRLLGTSTGWIIESQTPAGLSYTAENIANKGEPNGYCPLNESGFVPSAYILGTSDIIVEVSTYSALPTTGSANTIYFTQDTNLQYRWTGTQYIQIDPMPGTTTSIAEGTNLYFTYARVLGALLTGLNTTISGTITATDSVLSAFGKLQNAVTSGIALSSVLQGYITTLQGQVTNAAIIGQHLTGFTATNGTVSSSSTILSALENLQYEISNASTATASIVSSGCIADFQFTETSGITVNNSISGSIVSNGTITAIDGSTPADYAWGRLYNFGLDLSVNNVTQNYVLIPTFQTTDSNGSFYCEVIFALRQSPNNQTWQRIFEYPAVDLNREYNIFLTSFSGTNNVYAPGFGWANDNDHIAELDATYGSYNNIPLVYNVPTLITFGYDGIANVAHLGINGAQFTQNSSFAPAVVSRVLWMGRSQYSGDPKCSGTFFRTTCYNRFLSLPERQNNLAAHKAFMVANGVNF